MKSPNTPADHTPLRKAPVIRSRAVDAQAQNRLIASGIHPLLARLYASRGVQHANDADDALEGLLAPSGMKNIREAAIAIANAIAENKKLLVVADYDADGATACAIAIRGLARFGARVDFLVPDRFKFGYGLTTALVEHAMRVHADDPPDWIITVDNGISSIEGVRTAHAHGIKVLVTDHHLPGKALPDCLIINPNQPDCSFASKNLAGVGVMFYLLMALRAYVRDELSWEASRIPRLDDLLPIVALGTVADVVRLDANNRRLVAAGLARLRKGNAFAGLNALFAVANIDVRDANTGHFGFVIGPRLNAAGRIDDMTIGIACLLEDDYDRAMAIAQQLDQFNHKRREIEAQARDHAAEQAYEQLVQQADQLQDRMSIVLHGDRWHQGVVGLVASRLKDTFWRPTVIFASDDDPQFIKGSCRSVPGVHIRDVLERIDTTHPGLIRAFGGHAMAAGLTLERNRFDLFAKEFEISVRAFADTDTLQEVLEVDGPLSSEHFRLDLAQLLSRQIWGQGFAAPVFVNEFHVISQQRLKEKHLKALLVPHTPDGVTGNSPARIEAIWFNAPQDLASVARIAYRLDINHYQGRSSLQLGIVGLA